MPTENHRLLLMQEYEAAPDEAMFSQLTVAASSECLLTTDERECWAGTGVPFRKFGHSVRYCKADIRAWLEQHPAFQSTTHAQYAMKAQKAKENEHNDK